MTTLWTLLEQAAGQWPDRPAVNDVTYHELRERALRLARVLTDRGVTPGDRVVLVAPASVTTAAFVYAAARVGAPFVLLHGQTAGEPLGHVLDDCTPALVLGAGAEAPAEVSARGIAYRFAEVDDDATASLPEPPIGADPVCLIYTSGTTSLPKAVVSTHAQLRFAAGAIGECLNYRPDDVVFCPLPPSFDYGLYQLFLAAQSGARVVLAGPGAAGPGLVRQLRESGATVLPGMPSVSESLARLLEHDRSGGDGIRLRLLTNTGAAMPASVLSRLRAALPDLHVQVMFGLTECKRATIMPVDGDLARPGSSGLPLPGTRVLILGDDDQPVPAGQVGQIVVRGQNVMAGYWRRPELTAQRFPRPEDLFPELRTGDYGYLDADGYLYFDGRRDDIYKERGFRVSSIEVEAAARLVEGVGSAAVLPPTPQRPSVLVAATERPPDRVLTEIGRHLEPFKIPQRCVVVDELPLTGNGKVDRKALATLVGGGRD
jgi:acyl-CoA synthetase (AMP-forming)/AMP-acid ligase II